MDAEHYYSLVHNEFMINNVRGKNEQGSSTKTLFPLNGKEHLYHA